MKRETKSKRIITALFGEAGIRIGGDGDGDIKVLHEDFYSAVLSRGSIALGEAYMEGWWECKDLCDFFYRLFRSRLENKAMSKYSFLIDALLSRVFNRQTVKKSKKVAKHHYDIHAEFYMSFLDPYNQYSCGYFKNTRSLNKAQEQKLQLICEKLELKKADTLLDIGCGWGGLAKFASSRYGCSTYGITLSEEQYQFAAKDTKGLSAKIAKADYRTLEGQFDKIVSVGMFEHVGYKNYRTYMKKIHSLLKEDGLFLLQTIGNNQSTTSFDPWMNKYIFPNAMLPSIKQIGRAAEGLFVMEDWHNFGPYYHLTLIEWFKRFHKHWDKFKAMYGETFCRMWKYYLLACAGGFKARNLQLWQIVFSQGSRPGVYSSLR